MAKVSCLFCWFLCVLMSVAMLPCSKSLHMRLGRLGGWRSDAKRVNLHFGGPIEEKVSGLEGSYVANPYI